MLHRVDEDSAPLDRAPPGIGAPAGSHSPAKCGPSRDSGGLSAPLDLCLSAGACYCFTSLIVALSLYFGVLFMRPPPYRPARQNAMEVLTASDAAHYLRICRDGYSYDPTMRSNVAFFPLYPLVARWLAEPLGMPPLIALMLVSNVCLLAALVALYAYARSRFAGVSPRAAGYAVIAAAVFPTGCFFRLAYSESLFLLLAIISLLAMQRRAPAWVAAGLVGAATAARPVGVALLAPLAIFLWDTRASNAKGLARVVLFTAIGCWGIVGYIIFQWRAFDEPWAFVVVQRHWGMRHAPSLAAKAWALATLEPVAAVYDAGSSVFWDGYDHEASPFFSLQFANPVLFIGALASITIGAARRWLDRYELAAALPLVLIPYVTRGYEMGMGSMGRFMAVVFPIYLVAGRLLARLPQELAGALLCVSACWLATLAALYASGRMVF